MGNAALFESLESRTLFDVTLDAGFGTHGVLDLGAGGISARATQDDGKILVAGALSFHLPDVSDEDVTRAFVMRLLPDGTPDSSFGGVAHGQPDGTPDGTVVFADKGILEHVRQMIALPDSGILLSGDRRIARNVDGALIKLSSDGRLTKGFGGASTGYMGNLDGTAFYSDGPFNQLAVAPDGRIAVVVPPTPDDPLNPRAFRAQILMFDDDGSVDTDFATRGIYSESVNETNFNQRQKSLEFDAIAFTSDGTLLVTRVQYSAPDQTNDGSAGMVLFDIKADGTAGPASDATVFSRTGENIPTILFANEFAPLADGSFLLQVGQNDNRQIAVYHVLSNGTIDPGFGNGNGVATLDLPGASVFLFPSLAVLPDGRFYVAAVADGTSNVERFLPDGTIDPIFGTGPVADLFAHSQLIAPSGDSALLMNADFQNSQETTTIRRIDGGAHVGRTATGTLLVGGTSDHDEISLSVRRSDRRLVARIDGSAKSFTMSSIKRIRIYSYGGDDSITVGAGVRAIFADAGADKDTIIGGSGDDTLLGNTGADSISGGDGADSISGGGGNDVLSGGNGNDSLAGNGGHDTLNGDAGDDVLFGGPGFADTINGGPGNDLAAQDFSDKYSGVETLV